MRSKAPLITLSVDAAAKVLGVNPQKVYRAVEANLLKPLVGYEHVTFSQQSIVRAKGKFQ